MGHPPWRRLPTPPTERRTCDCDSLAAQNAELRARLRLHAELVDVLEQRRQGGYPMPDAVSTLLDRLADG